MLWNFLLFLFSTVTFLRRCIIFEPSIGTPREIPKIVQNLDSVHLIEKIRISRSLKA